jgi:hypothetical protein
VATIINDIEYSWADIRVKVRGKELISFKGIKYGDKVTREKVFGARRHAIKRTRGKVEVDDCSITMHESAVRELLDILGDGWADALVDEIVVQYGGDGLPTHTDVLESVYFEGLDGGGEEGSSAFEREVPFSCMKIKRDGKYIVARDR